MEENGKVIIFAKIGRNQFRIFQTVFQNDYLEIEIFPAMNFF